MVDSGAGAPVEAQEPSRRSKILRRTRVGGTLVAALVGLFWLVDRTGSPWLVWAVGSGLALGATVEGARMLVGLQPGAPRGLYAGLAGALAVSAVCVQQGVSPGVLAWAATAVGAAVAALLGGALSAPRATPGLAAIAAWIAAPLPLLAVAYQELALGGLIALVALSKVGDIAGYYAGNALGKHHPFPRLSPGKTTEGCTASFVFGVATAAAFSATDVLALELLPALVFGAAVNLASQAGDLAESALKRRTGVKDSGTWFGPSGGFLDLTDSLLFSVPVGLAVLAGLRLLAA